VSFRFDWVVRPEAAFEQMTTAYINRIRQGVRRIAHRRAVEIEEWMKANHLWQNITGAAEVGLESYVEQVGMDMVHIILEHGVSYGIFLELANGGRYAIITPALDYFGPQIWNDVQAMLS
jgi:hypothetical protein